MAETPEAPDVHKISALPDDIRESVAVADLKNFGTAPDLLLAFSMKDHVLSTKRIDGILETAMGKIIDGLNGIRGIEEATAVSKVAGSNLAEHLANLTGSMASQGAMITTLTQAMQAILAKMPSS
jgi:hypothetical protein